MPSAAWSGSISFGMVTIPVKLYSAVVDNNVHYHRIDMRTGKRIRLVKVAEGDEEPVPNEDVGKAYEAASGELVEIDADELAGISPKRSKTIEIEQFVHLEEIDPLIFDAGYQIVPDKSVVKPYALLCEALDESGRVAIARFVMRTVEHLAAIRPIGGHLALSTMVFAADLRTMAEFEELRAVSEAKVNAKELKVATQLIDSMTAAFDHEAFRDEHQEQMRSLIEAKASGDVDVISHSDPEDDSGAEVVDLMAALEASVKKARGGRKRAPAKRTAAKSKPTPRTRKSS